MRKLSKSFKARVESLFNITNEERQNLVSVLSVVNQDITPDDFSDVLREGTGIEEEKVEEIKVAVLTLYSAFGNSSKAPDEFSEKIIKDIFGDSQEDKTDEKGFLIQLLSTENPLSVLAKALGVLGDQDKIYLKSRIISDIVPIFSHDLETDISDVLVINRLKIAYHHNGEISETYISLSSQNLDELESVIQRARLKQEAISSKLSQASVNIYET